MIVKDIRERGWEKRNHGEGYGVRLSKMSILTENKIRIRYIERRRLVIVLTVGLVHAHGFG